jgi:hypothetical protein
MPSTIGTAPSSTHSDQADGICDQLDFFPSISLVPLFPWSLYFVVPLLLWSLYCFGPSIALVPLFRGPFIALVPLLD